MENYNERFLYPRRPNSARNIYEMSKQRNPIIETDKNMAKSLNENIKQTQLLNNVLEATHKNAIEINNLANLVCSNQEANNKQFKISLIVSIIVGLFAAGSFVLALISLFLNF